jgi:hypothetical protein
MQDRLRQFLKEPSATLTTIGYSFGDAHINELIVQGLQGNPGAMVFALQYEDISQYTDAKHTASENPGLTCLARDAAVIARREAAWLDSPNGDSSECNLGDFVCFGEQLRRLVGGATSSEESQAETAPA